MKECTEHWFNGITKKEQLQHLEEEGVYLDAIIVEGVYKIALFELYGFYVEVYYNKQTDTLDKLTAFTNYERLDPYLSGININPIYLCL